ncbi:MAG: GntR family transcriptional regulator, partial [Chitinivibrionales bacterium]|nr:GntR family transcriptional regulator [Chitinivibrionales bacterium]
MARIDAALRWLERQARSVGPGARLPPIKTMARRAGVSHAVMNAAVRALAERGVLSASPGSGTVVGAPAVTERRARRTGDARGVPQKWQQVAAVLARRVCAAGGQLPEGIILPKQVRIDFGITHATARKALVSLVEDGILRPHGRGYEPVARHLATGFGVLTVLCRPQRFHFVGIRSIIQSYVSEIGRACSLHQLELAYHHLGYEGATLSGVEHLPRALASLAKRCHRYMVLIISGGIHPDGMIRVLDAVRDAPTVLLDLSNVTDLLPMPH